MCAWKLTKAWNFLWQNNFNVVVWLAKILAAEKPDYNGLSEPFLGLASNWFHDIYTCTIPCNALLWLNVYYLSVLLVYLRLHWGYIHMLRKLHFLQICSHGLLTFNSIIFNFFALTIFNFPKYCMSLNPKSKLKRCLPRVQILIRDNACLSVLHCIHAVL